jgi:predicted O-methyltransferase YrrM
MKATTNENFNKALSRYIGNISITARDQLDILEVSDLLTSENSLKLLTDSAHQKSHLNSDQLEAATEKNRRFDIIFCHNSAELSANNNDFFSRILKLLKSDGYLLLIINTGASNTITDLIHTNKAQLLSHWKESRGVEGEHTFVIQRSNQSTGWDGEPLGKYRDAFIDMPTHLSGTISRASDEEEVVSGEVNYLDFFSTLHDEIQPKKYLEIGVRHGRSIAQAKCPSVGVDPSPDIKVAIPNATLYSQTSDNFFEHTADNILTNDIDMLFIDGMHLFEYALRDYMNCEKYTHNNSLVIMDDIFPSHNTQAARDRCSQVWTGDVWKVIPCLMKNRPDLALIGVDTSPTGLLLIINCNSQDNKLALNYNDILAEFVPANDIPVPEEIINRKGILAPDNTNLIAIFEHLRNKTINSPAAMDILEKIGLK